MFLGEDDDEKVGLKPNNFLHDNVDSIADINQLIKEAMLAKDSVAFVISKSY